MLLALVVLLVLGLVVLQWRRLIQPGSTRRARHVFAGAIALILSYALTLFSNGMFVAKLGHYIARKFGFELAFGTVTAELLASRELTPGAIGVFLVVLLGTWRGLVRSMALRADGLDPAGIDARAVASFEERLKPIVIDTLIGSGLALIGWEFAATMGDDNYLPELVRPGALVALLGVASVTCASTAVLLARPRDGRWYGTATALAVAVSVLPPSLATGRLTFSLPLLGVSVAAFAFSNRSTVVRLVGAGIVGVVSWYASGQEHPGFAWLVFAPAAAWNAHMFRKAVSGIPSGDPVAPVLDSPPAGGAPDAHQAQGTVSVVEDDGIEQPTTGTTAETKVCPFCAETIKAAALKCRFCGERLDVSAGAEGAN